MGKDKDKGKKKKHVHIWHRTPETPDYQEWCACGATRFLDDHPQPLAVLPKCPDYIPEEWLR